MLNPLDLISNFFGSNNKRELNKIRKLVSEINLLEKKVANIPDEEFPKKTSEFIKKLNAGTSLDEILIEAFGLVREASRRVLGERHFDVQLLVE